MLEVVAPHTGEITSSDGDSIMVDEKVDGGPSVLFDAIVILPGSDDGVKMLADMPPAITFVSDAFNHKKFIGYVEDAMPLMKKAGLSEMLDEGCMQLTNNKTTDEFTQNCRDIRFWQRAD